MRQRTINWAGAMRDMRRYRSPEQMLIREMLEALKAVSAYHGNIGLHEPFGGVLFRVREVIAKAERHTNG